MTYGRKTNWGSFSFSTRIKARSPESTFIIPDGERHSLEEITRNEFAKFATYQDQYLASVDTFQVNGNIGAVDDVFANVQLTVEDDYPHIAAMQKQLFFTAEKDIRPDFSVIYTPDLPVPDSFPNRRCVLVDLENYTTRIAGTDYFGESKKAGLRMWNKWIYDHGGLALHAGCKVYTDNNGRQRSMLIIGLSGTGKTTTTFTPHHGSLPVQDDFCALFSGGKIYASENGCFAKTFALNEADEPQIYAGVSSPEAWLENVYVDADGRVDFYNNTHTTNGRGTFELDLITHGSLTEIPPLSKILILNRCQDIIPAIAKLDHQQAAAFFMLGETTGTSAGGASEAGKSLRIPGTNPFFPLDHTLQGNRFLSILSNSPDVEVYLMNTGYIGQADCENSGEKISIKHSRKIIEALLSDELRWEPDPDFHYQKVKMDSSSIHEIFISPRKYYTSTGRDAEFRHILQNLKKERISYLSQYPELDESMIRALR